MCQSGLGGALHMDCLALFPQGRRRRARDQCSVCYRTVGSLCLPLGCFHELIRRRVLQFHGEVSWPRGWGPASALSGGFQVWASDSTAITQSEVQPAGSSPPQVSKGRGAGGGSRMRWVTGAGRRTGRRQPSIQNWSETRGQQGPDPESGHRVDWQRFYGGCLGQAGQREVGAGTSWGLTGRGDPHRSLRGLSGVRVPRVLPSYNIPAKVTVNCTH